MKDRRYVWDVYFQYFIRTLSIDSQSKGCKTQRHFLVSYNSCHWHSLSRFDLQTFSALSCTGKKITGEGQPTVLHNRCRKRTEIDRRQYLNEFRNVYTLNQAYSNSQVAVSSFLFVPSCHSSPSFEVILSQSYVLFSILDLCRPLEQMFALGILLYFPFTADNQNSVAEGSAETEWFYSVSKRFWLK